MGLGVLEPNEAVVPGTIQLYDAAQPTIRNGNAPGLKHTPDGLIVLAPQPSDDPNDPLNWPRWRRDFNYGLIMISAILSLIHGPLLAPVTVVLATEYEKSIGDIAQLTSYSLLVISGFAYVFSILSRLYGKRGLFIFATATLVASDIWAGKAADYGSMMGARVLSGVGQSMFEALSLAIVPDLFFVHERGLRVAAFLFVSQSGVTLAQPIATHIATEFGLNWAFYGLAISEAVMLIAIILFFWECSFSRDHDEPLAHMEEIVAHDSQEEKKETGPDAVCLENVEHSSKRLSHRHHLRIYSGKISSFNIGTLTWRTLALNFHPTIFWAAISGLPLSWPVGISYTIALALESPPYNFSANGVSNLFIASWFGATLALAIGATQDLFVQKMTKRNNNIYEPEFRLWYALPGLIFSILGFVGWGWGIQAGVSWVGLAFFFAFVFTGALLVNSAIISYIIDGYRMYSIEAQVVLFAFKNLFPFGMGYFFFEWYAAAGPKVVFGIVGAIIGGVGLTTIPFYVFGKRMRNFWDKHPFLGIKDMSS